MGGGAAMGGGAGGGIGALPGLVLWLDAAKGVTGTTSVTAWADQSGNQNDLAGSGAMLSAGAVNGLPAITLSSSTLQAMNNPSFGFGTDELLVEEVVRVNATHSLLFGTSGMRLQSATVGGFAQLQLGPSTTVDGATSLNDATWRVVAARRSGSGASATIDVRLNGGVDGTATGSQYAYDVGSTSPATVGGSDTIEDVAEVVVIKGTISVADLGTLEGYLKTKYGL